MSENNQIENTELTSLPNIGKEMKRQLNAVGINTPEELVATGSREAWLRIRAIDSSACYNRLCGLEGAIQGIRWHHLDDNLKKELKAFYEANRLGQKATIAETDNQNMKIIMNGIQRSPKDKNWNDN